MAQPSNFETSDQDLLILTVEGSHTKKITTSNSMEVLSSESVSSLVIISGGQTGVDRAALEAARDLGIRTGGTAPKGFLIRNERGKDVSDFSLKDFGLSEHASPNYPPRTKANVDNSDVTIAIRLHPSSGTDFTIGYASTGRWKKASKTNEQGHKPVFVVDSLSSSQSKEIFKFLQRLHPRTINVAGHRECPESPNFQEDVKKLLSVSFQLYLDSFE